MIGVLIIVLIIALVGLAMWLFERNLPGNQIARYERRTRREIAKTSKKG